MIMLNFTVPNAVQCTQLLQQCTCALLLVLNFSITLAQSSVPSNSVAASAPPVRLQSLNPDAPGYRPRVEPRTDLWLGSAAARLEFAQHCMRQVKPTHEGLIERVIRFSHARGQVITTELQEGLEKLKTPAGQAALVQLAPAQIAQSFKDMGITLDPTGFNAATYTVPGRSVFYAIKGSDSCVLDIKTPSASLAPILSWGGWSNKYYSSPGVLRNEIMFPRIVKEVDSINIRTLQATWQDDKFTSRFVMRGNYGVDSEQLSRLELEQEYGRMRVVMSPALPEDLKRLGMDSAQSPWPVSESIHTHIGSFISAKLNPVQQKPWVINWWKNFESMPFEMKPDLWPYSYLTEAAKRQMPKTMYTPSVESPVGLDADFKIIFAAIPKDFRRPESIHVLVRPFYLSRQNDQQSPYREERGKGYQSLDLRSPKLNEGLAKGLATYRLEGEPEGVRKTYEMVIKTQGVLPDDKLLSFAQIRLMLPHELMATKDKKR
jgi:hypothetical protein